MKSKILLGIKWWTLSVLLTLVAGMTGLAQADEKVPRPRDDPFYTPTADYASLPNGSILRERKINAEYLIGLLSTDVVSVIGDKLGDKIELLKNLKINAYQLLYKSVDSHDQPVAEVVTILIPQGPYLGKGARPLIAYGNAIDGVSDRCWPSYALRAGLTLQNVTSPPSYDTGETLVALLSGYAVSYTDYVGPRSQWLDGPQSGHAMLDGIRATLKYAPVGLSPNSQVGLLGYSGGGGATGWAAALRASYAPELNIVGAALGVPSNGDLASTFEFIDGKLTTGVIGVGLVGLNRAYPEAGIEQYFNESGRQLLTQLSDSCLIDGAVTHAFIGPIENYTISPAVKIVDSAPGKFIIKGNSLVEQPNIPDMPVLIYGDVFDDLVGIQAPNNLAKKYCKAGAQVEVMHTFVPTPFLALVHVIGEIEGTLPSLGYLANRFEGKPPRNDCDAGSMNVWSSSLPLPYYPFITQ